MFEAKEKTRPPKRRDHRRQCNRSVFLEIPQGTRLKSGRAPVRILIALRKYGACWIAYLTRSITEIAECPRGGSPVPSPERRRSCACQEARPDDLLSMHQCPSGPVTLSHSPVSQLLSLLSRKIRAGTDASRKTPNLCCVCPLRTPHDPDRHV
jgi:hypothetical protein